VLTALDGRQSAKRTNRDFKYLYDDLDRLVESKRGIDGGSFTHVANNANFTPSQKWGETGDGDSDGLDFLTNWKYRIIDMNNNGPDGASPDITETRVHNDANELTSLDPDGSGGGAAFPITHDKAGNIRERRLSNIGSNGYTKYLYTHDAWNRLVKVQHVTKPDGSAEGSPVTIQESEYNGLSWRVVKRSDTSAPTVNGLDEMRVMIYSAGWQMIEERVDTGWSSGFTADDIYQTIYGLRYIDDVICRRLDHDVDGDYTDGGSGTYYHMTDNQFSTVAVLDQNSNLLERVSYDPYGRSRHHWMADVDGDGDQDSGDITTIFNLGPGSIFGVVDITSGTYNVEADIDRDGDIDDTDHSIANTDGTRTALTNGFLSNVGNTLGYSGYVFNFEVSAGMYTVRFRHYDVGLGRWLERDPLEYIDGMSLYGYVRGMPLKAMDPLGLQSDPFYGYPEAFKQWFHRSIKQKEGIPANAHHTDEQIEAYYRQWVAEESPISAKGKGKTLRDRRGGKVNKRALGLGALLAGWLTDQAIGTVDALSGSRAYRMLLAALERGDISDADRWAYELYLELVESGVPYAGLNFQKWWDEELSPMLRPLRERQRERQSKSAPATEPNNQNPSHQQTESPVSSNPCPQQE
jgi:RHS repeat-associated protein